MSAHTLPARTPAAESPASATRVPAEGHTLTVPLRFARSAMSGRLAVRETTPELPDTVRLRVALPPQEPLNFTA